MKNNTELFCRVVKNEASKILLLVTLGLFLISIAPVKASEPVSGQQATLTGTVKDSFTGQPISGVKITIKGSKTVAITDKAGVYSIVLPKDAKTLFFILKGYETLSVEIKGRTEIYVEMTAVQKDPKLW
jgi:hypothetical protein